MTVTEAILTRRAIRQFTSEPVGRETVAEILSLANRAPSSYNLQPWSFVAVEDPATKAALTTAALGQSQVADAPWVIVLLSDPRAAQHNLEPVLHLSLEAGALSEKAAVTIRKLVKLSFSGGFLGLGRVLLAAILGIIRLFRPLPTVPSPRAYWDRETMLAADHLLLAARGHGLDTCPMTGFDPGRVKAALGVPGHLDVSLLIPLGHAQPDNAPLKPRLPLADKLHWNRFG